MSLLNVRRERKIVPRKTVIYGPIGVGKTKFGLDQESPILIATEEGQNDFDAPIYRWEDKESPDGLRDVAKTIEDIEQAIGVLYTETHEYKTLVLDTADWLEPLVWRQVAAEHNVQSIEDIGFGKGYTYALEHWARIFEGLDALRLRRGMEIVIVAHAESKKVESPDVESYDQYATRLHKLANAKLIEWADEVIFAGFDISVRTEEQGFNKKRNIASGGARVLHTEFRPAAVAKNRLGLPPQMPLDGKLYREVVRGKLGLGPLPTIPTTEATTASSEPPAEGGKRRKRRSIVESQPTTTPINESQTGEYNPNDEPTEHAPN